MHPTSWPRLAAVGYLLALTACTQSYSPRRMPGPVPLDPGAVSVSAPSVPGVPGFSSAIRMGLTVHLSGQVALDSAANLVGTGDLALQSRQALTNLLSLVRAARGLPGDVVKLTFYVKGLEPAAAHTVQEVSAELFPEQPAPAVTIVGVAALPAPELLVAVDGVAVLRGEFPDRQRVGAR